ncbi:hypothetical protein OGM63_06930 [Plectonema radiosum NIES-515]|uniref:Uncharacterized protein n=1 Tax=Plectonema radiosum NIES-515 TaxID=2986073 RepID=A0ABT3AVZ8_9CYAN|nr:hypothetical protein [Plectonema radiosum]MCV3213260.1 hypothetical protein [Plectonema radiosum NIES-515]
MIVNGNFSYECLLREAEVLTAKAVEARLVGINSAFSLGNPGFYAENANKVTFVNHNKWVIGWESKIRRSLFLTDF